MPLSSCLLDTRRCLSLAALSVMLLPAALSPALAASACKGSEQQVCESRDDCRWVAGYTRKDGIEVSGHCRNSGKKAPSTDDGAKKTES